MYIILFLFFAYVDESYLDKTLFRWSFVRNYSIMDRAFERFRWVSDSKGHNLLHENERRHRLFSQRLREIVLDVLQNTLFL